MSSVTGSPSPTRPCRRALETLCIPLWQQMLVQKQEDFGSGLNVEATLSRLSAVHTFYKRLCVSESSVKALPAGPQGALPHTGPHHADAGPCRDGRWPVAVCAAPRVLAQQPRGNARQTLSSRAWGGSGCMFPMAGEEPELEELKQLARGRPPDCQPTAQQPH